jgi:hypothetical protein
MKIVASLLKENLHLTLGTTVVIDLPYIINQCWTESNRNETDLVLACFGTENE